MLAPDRGCRALRNGLPVKGGLAGSCVGRVYSVDQLLYGFGGQMTAEFGLDAAGMDGRGSHAIRLVSPVEFDGE